MRRLIGPALGPGCVLALMLACFGKVLFGGHQFGYRDAAHFYYPLYERVEQEWSKGRLPLWDARENAGMPLLGNPTAAVLYPGKLIYRALPYPWAARVYTVAHVALAAAGMYWLLRGWSTSRAGSLVGAMGYAFGAPILFQYCNVIFLVGASWVPIGLKAADGWLASGRRLWILVLAGVLAMQVLGGDPQAAYGTGLCAGAYAVGLAIVRRRSLEGASRPGKSHAGMMAIGLTVAWFAGALVCAWVFPKFRPPRTNPPPVPLPWSSSAPALIAFAWAAVAIAATWWRRRSDRVLPTMISGLAVAAVLAALISAAQLVPVMEYTSRTVRAAEDGPHDIYPFSLEPYRLAELIWPEVFGSTRATNRSWASYIPPKHTMEIWVPSLYLGGITTVLALSAFGFRGGARRAWLSGIAAVGLASSLGEFGSPLWMARNLPAVARVLGPHDPVDTAAMRLDGKLRDGDGGVYSLMANILPGFGSFRYPSKMLTFACFGLAGLAGLGFDRVMAGRSRRALPACGGLAAVSLIGLVVVQAGHSAIVSALKSGIDAGAASSFGPLDHEGAWLDIRNAMLQGSVVLVASFLVFSTARRHPRLAGTAALVLLAGDLILANARLIITVPQSVFDEKPLVLRKIEEAEKADPAPGPYRVHRMPYWEPVGWISTTSPDRYRELVEWERKTIQPKYAIPYGLSYTLTEGVAELYDFWWFFSPFLGNRRKPNEPMDPDKNPRLVYYPRRGFDLWNTRYFLLPAINANEERRAISSFLRDTEAVYPTKEQLSGDEGRRFFDAWSKAEDWQLLKNKNAYPRSWVVHTADFAAPIVGLSRKMRAPIMTELLYLNDPFWSDGSRQVQDLRRRAYVELDNDRASDLFKFLSGAEPDASETCEVVGLDDVRVEIRATLKSNGLVILSDVDYPGWELTVDGRPATILRANRLMRGAAVEAGPHTLVYRYRPKSVILGFAITALGLAGALAFAVLARYRPTSARLDIDRLARDQDHD